MLMALDKISEERAGSYYVLLTARMFPVQGPVRIHCPATRKASTVFSYGAKFPHLDAFRDSTLLEEGNGNHATRKGLESVVHFTLQTYQAAAVVVRTTNS